MVVALGERGMCGIIGMVAGRGLTGDDPFIYVKEQRSEFVVTSSDDDKETRWILDWSDEMSPGRALC